MHVQALAPGVFFSTCDDKPESLDALKVKLQEAKRVLTEQVARLRFVQEPIQWKTATDYKVLATQLIDIEAKVEGVFARLCSCCGIEKQIALQAKSEAILGLIQEEKSLELEVALTLKKLKKLKKLCESKDLRSSDPKNLPKALAAEPDLTRFSGYSSSYGFWKSVPYTVQGAYSAPAILGGGYYQASGKLGSDLEAEVGQKLNSLLERIEERILSFCSWEQTDSFEQELASYQECLGALYKRFTELYALVETIELDVLTKTICDYAYGLKYAFSEAQWLLKVLGRCMQPPSQLALESIHDLGELYRLDGAVRGELEKVSLLYAALQRVIQADSYKSESKKSFDNFLSRLFALFHDVHANIDPALLRLNQEEARVFGRLLRVPMNDASVMSYLAKRMVAALYFPMRDTLDIELELALHISAGFEFEDEAFRAIHQAYEQAYSSKRIHTRTEYAQAVTIAKRIAEIATTSCPIFGYLECCQMYSEFRESIGHKKSKAFRPVLLLALERVATEHRFTTILEVDEQVSGQFLGSKAAAALFASKKEARVAAYRCISSVIEDARYENELATLSSDVCQMLYKTTIQKLLAFSYNSSKVLGMREMRLFVDGPVDKLLSGGAFTLDAQMALYKLIKKERERGGVKPLSDTFKERYSEAQFNRWYTSFDDLYRKNSLIQGGKSVKDLSMQPIASDQALQQIAGVAVGNDGVSVEDRAIWEAVVAKQHTIELAPKVQAYLLKCIPAVVAKNTLDVALELMLYSMKSDRTDRSLWDACKGNKVLFGHMSQYERVFQHNRSDILLKEAADVLQPVLRMQSGKFDLLTYASSWQKCIEFARKPGLEGVEKEQHAKLAGLLYAKLDALSKKPEAITLLGSHRYCSLTSNQLLSGTNEGILFRLLACCLFGSDPAERQQAQQQVTNHVEMLHAYKSVSEGVMSLLYENTMDKIIKGGFDVGSVEKALFVEGPLTHFIRKERIELGDCKLQHALFFLIVKERLAANGQQPVLDRFLQVKGRAAFEEWYKQYQQFLASGPIAENASLVLDDWQDQIAFSHYLTDSWE